jgi:RNA polymerase sigma-70 factor (ECF subfamily)
MVFVKNGDHRAFAEIYDRYSSRLNGYFLKMLWSDREKAEDAVHDLFAKIIDRPHLFQEGYLFKSWIFQIASNMCKNAYRKRSFEMEYRSQLEKEGIDFLSIERKMDENIQLNELHKVLNELDEEKKSLFLLRYQQEMSMEDLSKVFEVPEGTIKSRLHHIRKNILIRMETNQES